jgi:hypothetical protein
MLKGTIVDMPPEEYTAMLAALRLARYGCV